MEVKIIPCIEEYVAECVRISVTSYDYIHEKYAELMGRDLHDGVMPTWRADKAKAIDTQQRGEKAFVALADGQVAGFAAWDEMPHYGQIRNNAVDPQFRGHGIAGMLYNHVLDEMRRAGLRYAAVSTGLDDGHASARRAYQKVGFKNYLPEINYYRKLDDSIVPVLGAGDDGAKIVPFSAEHLAVCRNIALTAWTPIYASYKTLLGDALFAGVMPDWEIALANNVQALLESGHGYVLLVHGEIAGFIGWRVSGHNGRIGFNAVAPKFRGHGFAGRMHAYVMAEMKKEGFDYVQVHTGLDDAHAPARSAYLKSGFEKGLPCMTFYRTL